jgi:transposase
VYTSFVDIAREKDIEQLRKAALLLANENQWLVTKVAELTKQLLKAQGKDAEALQLQIGELEHQLAARNKMLFGQSSERRSRAGKSKGADKSPQKGHGPREQPLLEVEEPEPLELDAADRVCTSCGGGLAEWPGKLDESEEISVLERRFVLRKIKRKKYRCKCGACIETAPGPLKLFPGARYSIDFAIEVVIAKYLDHLPLERQVRAMLRDGLHVDSQTLFDQCHAVATALQAAYEKLHAHLLIQRMLGADETRWPVHGEKEKASKWHAWVLASDDAVYYEVHDSRSAEAARKLLGDFCGYLMCDGFSGYGSVAKSNRQIRLVHCWAHVRREFIDIERSFPKDVERIVHLIGLLYRIERRAKSGRDGDEKRRKLRDRRSRVVIAAIQKWCLDVRCTPESALAKAIKYMTDRWTPLTAFLDEPLIPLDNNHSERGLRGLVIGRKNHYGSRSRRGSEVAAILYSLLETAKLVGVDPRDYLRAALTAHILRGEALIPHDLLAPASAA